MAFGDWARCATLTCFVLASVSAAAEAQGVTVLQPPDPATVSVPDLSIAPKSQDDRSYDVYFYFYRANTTYGEAFADLDVCRIYSLSARLVLLPPKFVPLGVGIAGLDSNIRTPNLYLQYGLIGSLIGGIIIENAQDDLVLATDRRCMAYKGYRRFGTSRAIWKLIDSGTDTDRLARLARLASGPQPQAEALDP